MGAEITLLKQTLLRNGRIQGLHRNVLGILLLALMLALWGCHPSASGPQPAAVLPPLPIGQPIEAGISRYTVTLSRNIGPLKLLVFLPGRPIATPTPCLFIAPAGTPLVYGSSLDDGGNLPEYLPYLRAGFAVVVYEIDGDPGSEKPNDLEIMKAARAFKEAHAGIDDAREAIRYALARIPNIDPNRLYTAGHSSAATLALQVAENDNRIAACVAYAPCTDVPARIGAEGLKAFDSLIPDFAEFIRYYSPLNATTTLTCPVFIFHADDDSNVPASDNADFVAKLQQTNTQVTFTRVPTGNHYQSMIDQGLPRAVEWLKQLPARAPAASTQPYK